MSKYEWESGTLTVPTAALSELRAAVRAANNAYRIEVVALLDGFYAEPTASTRSARKFTELLGVWHDRHHTTHSHPAVTDAYNILSALASKPRKPTQADINSSVPAATSRTKVFSFPDFTIVFDGRLVQWLVEENNHAVDTAHSHPVARAFFASLARIRWTRGTGGVLCGNDEYNEEDRNAGGGANYVTAHFGPLGDRPSRLTTTH